MFRALLYRLLGLTKWTAVLRPDDNHVWRRINPETLQWEEKPMTEQDKKDALSDWSQR